MQTQLSRLVKGTLLYSVGPMLSRILTFILLPFTTKFLTIEGYGIIGTLGILTQFLSGLLTLGFGVSIYRLYWSVQTQRDRIGIIWSSTALLLLSFLFWITLIYFFKSKISQFLFGSENWDTLIVMSCLATSIPCILLPFTVYLRILEKGKALVCINLVEITAMLSTLVYFLMLQQEGAQGVVKSQLAAQIAFALCMFLFVLPRIQLSFSWKFMPELISIGYPYIIGTTGFFLIEYSSRFTLTLYFPMQVMGGFFLAYNFARVIELLVSCFTTAWSPFFSSYLHQENTAQKLFSKVLTYYVIFSSIIVLPFFCFSKPTLHLMTTKSYQSSWHFIGVIALSLSMRGVYNILGVGFLFLKQGKTQIALELGTGIICFLFSLLLIPFFGLTGAVLANLLSYTSLVVITYYLNQILFPIKIEWRRVTKCLFLFFIGILPTFVETKDMLSYTLLMFSNYLLYISITWKYILTVEERQYIRSKFKHLYPIIAPTQ